VMGSLEVVRNVRLWPPAACGRAGIVERELSTPSRPWSMAALQRPNTVYSATLTGLHTNG
jgi:hypothetical protein